jgi:2-haloacid dehalogenase
MKPGKNDSPAIVFDFGGVLIDWNPRYLYRKLFAGDEQSVEHFLLEIGFDEWNLRQDAGRPFSEAVAELCGQFPQHCELIQAYHDRYEESILGPIRGTVEILSILKDWGYPLYALSNWSVEKFALVRPHFAFFDWFQAIVLSGEVKLAKPDRRIFILLLEKIGRKAPECLLIDDSAANIAVAQELGFRTIHFSSPEQLQSELHQIGIMG